MDPTLGGAGMLRAEKVMDRVRHYTGHVNIEDLRIPFTAVAADLISQREVWFTTGDLVDAMRASIAIPTVFTPVTRDGMVLADGGLINPVRSSPSPTCAPTRSSRWTSRPTDEPRGNGGVRRAWLVSQNAIAAPASKRRAGNRLACSRARAEARTPRTTTTMPRQSAKLRWRCAPWTWWTGRSRSSRRP